MNNPFYSFHQRILGSINDAEHHKPPSRMTNIEYPNRHFDTANSNDSNVPAMTANNNMTPMRSVASQHPLRFNYLHRAKSLVKTQYKNGLVPSQLASTKGSPENVPIDNSPVGTPAVYFQKVGGTPRSTALAQALSHEDFLTPLRASPRISSWPIPRSISSNDQSPPSLASSSVKSNFYWPMGAERSNPGDINTKNPAGDGNGASAAPINYRNIQLDDATKIAMGYSPTYAGNPWLAANQSADIPHTLNCSIFIVNLPPSLTVHRLIVAIHSMGPLGRIYALHINSPELTRGHQGCAAKVVFFKREVAHTFMALCEDRGGLYVDGQKARVMWNRIKSAENPLLANSDASRVLLIGGPGHIVHPTFLTDFFKSKLDFQLDEVLTRIEDPLSGTRVLEYRFGSFRCQAQAAKMALAREFPDIRCFFHKDPLEPGAWNPTEYLEASDTFVQL